MASTTLNIKTGLQKMTGTLTLSIKQLSSEINLAIKTIRTTLVRNPHALPPRLLIQGQKRLLWLRSDVEKFYESQVRAHGSNPDFTTQKQQLLQNTVDKVDTIKRGRPTKSEQMARIKK